MLSFFRSLIYFDLIESNLISSRVGSDRVGSDQFDLFKKSGQIGFGSRRVGRISQVRSSSATSIIFIIHLGGDLFAYFLLYPKP
jgi:hypothetical protein